MTSFTITDTDLETVKDQVVIVTGASSGIGLATVKRLLQHGAKVYASDLNPLPSPEAASVPFHKVDVTSWSAQLEMFKAAQKHYGKIDHVFANAGIGGRCNLTEDDADANGDPLPPDLKTVDVNVTSIMYTVKLAIHYLKKNDNGGSIVLTASASSYARFLPTDYTMTKHAVLGLMRALSLHLQPTIPIRINAIAPSWTATSLFPPAFAAALGDNLQTPDAVARSAVVLMADRQWHGACVLSQNGRFWDMENGEKGIHAALKGLMDGADPEGTLAIIGNIMKEKEVAAQAGAAKG